MYTANRNILKDSASQAHEHWLNADPSFAVITGLAQKFHGYEFAMDYHDVGGIDTTRSCTLLRRH